MAIEYTFKADVERLHLGPGDAVLVRIRSHLNQDQMDYARDQVRRVFGSVGIDNCVVVDDSVDVSVIEKDGP